MELDVVSGTFRTDGSLGELAGPATFNLLSFDTVLVNGTAPTFTSNSGGTPPPFFATPQENKIDWDGTTASTEFLEARDSAAGINKIQINNDGPIPQPTWIARDDDGEFILFMAFPSEQFIPIPEPSSMMLVLAESFFLGPWRRCRRVC